MPGFVVIAAGAAYGFWDGPDGPTPDVMTQPVTRGDITDAVIATGTIDSLRTVQVGSQVSGTVNTVNADYNSIVHAGEIIAQLDPSIFETQVEIQQANVDRQQTEIGNQQLLVDNATLNLNRARDLFEKQLIAQQDLDAATLTASNAQAALDSARKQLVQAQAGLDQARLNLSYCTIRSPIDGVVIQRLVDPGQAVQSSMTTPQFFVLATSLDHLQLTASVDESDIGKVRPGQVVRFTVDTYRGRTFEGRVNSVRLNSTTTQNVVTYQTIVDVPNPDLRLRPGMTANLQIVIGTAHDVLRVPTPALRFRPTTAITTALGLPAGAAPALRLADQTPVAVPASTRVADDRVTQMPATRTATKIDDLFQPYQEPATRGQVWTWDAVARKLEPIEVHLGVGDGQFTALLSGNLRQGQSLVTTVVLPAPPVPARPSGLLMGPQRGGRYRPY